MVLVNEKSFQNVVRRGIIERIFDRPATLITICFILLSYTVTILFDSLDIMIFPSLLLILSALPAIILESRWIKTVKEEKENSILFFEIIKVNRTGFIFAGFISSFILILVAYVFELLLFQGFKSKINIFGKRIYYQVDIISIIAISIASVIIAFIVTASFYRVRGEEYDTGKRYTFLSSPAQVTTLSSYSMIGNFSIIWILWVGQIPITNMLFSRYINIEIITNSSFGFIFLMYSVFNLSVAYFANEIPYLIKDVGYRPPKRSMIKKWLRDLGLMIVIFSYAIYFRFNRNFVSTYNSFTMDILYIITIPIIYFLIIRKYPLYGKTCEYCNIIIEEENCISCGIEDRKSISFIMKKKKVIKHPTCPRCGKKWDNLRLKCDGKKCIGRECSVSGCDGLLCYNNGQDPNVYGECNFTISLTCEHCGKYINSLWKRCPHCNNPRSNIIEKALKSPGSEGFTRSIAYIRILIAFMLPIIILQISILIDVTTRLINEEYLDQKEYSLLYYLFIVGVTRFAILLFVIIAMIGTMIVTTKEKTRSLGMIANRYSLSAGTILMQTILIFFVFRQFDILFDQTDIYFIFKFIVVIISLGLLYFNFVGNYKLLVKFRPVTPFNPKLAISRRIKNR